MTFRLIVSDECHQGDLRIFAAVALHTDTLLLLMDEDQAIDFSRSPDKLVQRSLKLAGEYWSWQRALTRVSMVPIWSYLGRPAPRFSDCWRFGVLGVQFLNMVVPSYVQAASAGMALDQECFDCQGYYFWLRRWRFKDFARVYSRM